MTNRNRTVLIASLALIAATAGGWAYHYHHKYKHLATHEPGMMYRSAWLDAETMGEVVEDLQLRTVVNLCKPGEMGEARWEAERKAVSGANARLIELSMPTTIDADDPVLQDHIDVLSNPDNYPMLVHCQHGVTRTSKFLAMYDMLFRGIPGEESLESQPLFGREHQNVHVLGFVRQFQKRIAKERVADAASLDSIRQ